MNEAVRQLVALILQGIAWLLETAEKLWSWSWQQIGSVFNLSWAELPGWKLALGLLAVAVFAGVLIALFIRGWHAFARIARAFWTMVLALFGILAFVVAAGVFSYGFQWIVAAAPDSF